MPKEVWLIKDTNTDQYIHTYSTTLSNCIWGNSLGAQNFNTEGEADVAIEAWDEEPGERYIGSNPPGQPPHP